MSISIRINLLEMFPTFSEILTPKDKLNIQFITQNDELIYQETFIYNDQKLNKLGLSIDNQICSFKLVHKKDSELKVFIRIIKNNEIIGIGEFNLSITIFSRKEMSYKKWVTINDDKKKGKYNAISLINQIKLLIQAEMKYDNLDLTESTDLSFKKINLNNTSKHKDVRTEKLKEMKLFSNKTKAKFDKHTKNYSLNLSFNQSTSSINRDNSFRKKKLLDSATNKSNILKDKTDKLSLTDNNVNAFNTPNANNSMIIEKINDSIITSSFIDEIFNENDNNIENDIDSCKFDTTIKEYKQYYNKDYIDILPDNDEIFLKMEIKLLFDKFLEIHENYWKELKLQMDKFSQLKKFAYNYSEKYKLTFKKISRIKERQEYNNVKSDTNYYIKNEENKRIREYTNSTKNDLGIFGSFLGIKSDKTDNRNDEVGNYFSLIKKIFSDEEKLKHLNDEQIKKLNLLYSKYNIKTEETIIEDTPKKAEPTLDDKLNNYINENNSKRGNPHLDIIKINNNIYECGKSKIIILEENNGLRVQTDNGKVMTFEEYLEYQKSLNTKSESPIKNKLSLSENTKRAVKNMPAKSITSGRTSAKLKNPKTPK